MFLDLESHDVGSSICQAVTRGAHAVLPPGRRTVLPLHPGAWRDAVLAGRRAHAAMRHRPPPRRTAHPPPQPPAPPPPPPDRPMLNEKDLNGGSNGSKLDEAYNAAPTTPLTAPRPPLGAPQSWSSILGRLKVERCRLTR